MSKNLYPMCRRKSKKVVRFPVRRFVLPKLQTAWTGKIFCLLCSLWRCFTIVQKAQNPRHSLTPGRKFLLVNPRCGNCFGNLRKAQTQRRIPRLVSKCGVLSVAKLFEELPYSGNSSVPESLSLLRYSRKKCALIILIHIDYRILYAKLRNLRQMSMPYAF